MMISFIFLGLVAGVLSGVIGIGGGVVIVPALLYFFKFTQQQAQGTTLGLLVLPVGVLAAWTYHKHGLVDLRVAGLIALGFFIGGLIGAKLAVGLNNDILRKIFAVTLILIGLKMFFKP